MVKNNLFMWAKRELSQDAVIAYLINEKDKQSRELIQSMLKCNVEKSENKSMVKAIESVYCHGFDGYGEKGKKVPSGTDIFVEFTDKNNNMHAMIIEDKTDTTLHDYQLINYTSDLIKKNKTKKGSFKYKCIDVVYFKTGSFCFWELDEIKFNQQLINEESSVDDQSLDWMPKEAKEKLKRDLEAICVALKDHKIDIHFYVYGREKFLSFIEKYIRDIKESKRSSKPTWINDYRDYLFNLNKQHKSGYFGEDLELSIKSFKKELGISEGTKCLIAPPEVAAGKRPMEFKILDYVEKRFSNNYVLLPFVSIVNKDGKAECTVCLNLSKYVNKESYTGYKPNDSIVNDETIWKIIDKKVKEDDKYKKDYSLPSRKQKSRLRICNSKIISIVSKPGPETGWDFTELKEKVKLILELAEEIQNTFNSN